MRRALILAIHGRRERDGARSLYCKICGFCVQVLNTMIFLRQLAHQITLPVESWAEYHLHEVSTVMMRIASIEGSAPGFDF